MGECECECASVSGESNHEMTQDMRNHGDTDEYANEIK